MIGFIIGCAINAFILACIIKTFTDEEIPFNSAIVGAMIASIVTQFLVVVACRPIESPVASYTVQTIITFVVTCVVVQFLCSTDLKTIVKIVVVYTFVEIALAVCMAVGLVALLGE